MRKVLMSAPVVTGALLTATLFAPASAQAQDAGTTVLPEVVIQGQSVPPTQAIITEPNTGTYTPSGDGGSFLRSLPGVDGVKMGNHGVDPVIRGQQGDRLNVVSDGAYIYGGCPNRMDPPAALSSIDTYDKVTVEKGYQSVRHGGGGSGGAIILERTTPALTEANPYQGRVSLGGNANGRGFNSAADVAYKVGDGFLRGQLTASHSGNYNDGKGDDVRAAYDQWSGGLEGGWVPNDMTEVTASYERDEATNVLFAGAGMDSPYGYTDSTRLKLRQSFDGGPVQELRANAYGTWVDHLMDNYSLRTPGAMTMKAPSESRTYGFKVEGDVKAGDQPFVVGVDFKFRDRDAIRYRGTTATNTTTIQSRIWPGLENRQIGVFGEGTVPVAQDTGVKLGLRYDNVNVTANRANATASPNGTVYRSANNLYTMYYGKNFTDVTENNVSGLMRLDTKFGSDINVYAGISRNVRTADTNERAIAADHMTASSRWVGNPGIQPEQHHAFDVGMDTKAFGWNVSASAYYDQVTDYIMRDAARSQSGILLSDSATIYHNIDATLAGGEIAFDNRFGDLGIMANASYSYGENGLTGRPLPQIPPLKFTMDATYDYSGWTLGGRLNTAMTQNRVDDSTTTGSGLDVGKTSGYATMDLYGSTELVTGLDVGMGVTNLLDATYANHLNKSNAFDANQVQIYEPGRSFYLKVTGRF